MEEHNNSSEMVDVDVMDGKIYVYYLARIPGLPREDLFRELFSNEIFSFNSVTYPTSAIFNGNQITNRTDAEFTHVLLTTLSESRTKSEITIVLKDTSTSNLSPDTMAKLITEAVAVDNSWDVTYLCRWLDRCDQYGDNLISPLPSVFRSTSPNGTQALMFSSDGRDKILGYQKLPNGTSFVPLNQSFDSALNSAIENQLLIANVFAPNIIDFDTKFSVVVSDLAKSCSCRRPDDGSTTGPLPLLWFILVVIAVILFVWASKRIGPDTSTIGPRPGKT